MISNTFGIDFVYVVCKIGLQLDYIALVPLMFLEKGHFIQYGYTFVFMTACITWNLKIFWSNSCIGTVAYLAYLIIFEYLETLHT